MSKFNPSNLPPPVVTPMMPPSGMKIPYDNYVYKSKELLTPYIMTTMVHLDKQKEWTEKTIKTREKLEKLQERIWKDLPNYYGEISPMEIVSYMVDFVKVSEFSVYKIGVTMLSPKGVDWCNGMWKKLDGE